MAHQQHSSFPESSRFPRAPQPFLPTDDPLEQVGTPSRDVQPTHVLPAERDISGPPSAAPRRVVSQQSPPMDVNRFANARLVETPFDRKRVATSYDDGQPYEAATSVRKPKLEYDYTAPRRQANAEEDVHYTTNPFSVQTPRTPMQKPGIGSRVLATACLAASAMIGAAAVVLTLFMQAYIAVPAFLIAGALFFAGRGSLRESARRANDSIGSDPDRRREPDLED